MNAGPSSKGLHMDNHAAASGLSVMRVAWRLALLFAAGCLASCGRSPEESTRAQTEAAPPEERSITEQGLSKPDATSPFKNLEVMEFEEFESLVSRIPGTHEHYVVNGDVTIIGRRNLEEFFKRARGAAAGVVRGKLLINRLGAIDGQLISGRSDLWDPELRKQLTYCVSDELGDAHSKVVDAMAVASGDWERFADVDFVHAKMADSECAPGVNGVLFSIILSSLDDGVLASAPFPHFPRHERILRINDTYFESGGDRGIPLDGLLRHELGHVLGFDHEQNRPEAGSCFVADDNFAVTPFDPGSVMMYPECQRDGEFSGFQLSDLDRRGVACVYGSGKDSAPDDQTCKYRAATSNATGRRVATKLSEQTVAQGKWKYYEPLRVKPGSIMTLTLRRAASGGGDPDLYMRLMDRPSSREFDCGPRLDVEEEICRTRIPDRADGRKYSTVYIGVFGAVQSLYDLQIDHVAPEERA